LTILSFKSLSSTQIYLKNLVREKTHTVPIAIVADIQTNGIGSRNNKWISKEGNLFLSFAIPLKNLPSDLKLESASIYFAFILKETLAELGSKVFLKWPNDLYVNESKIGGMITNIVDDVIICGVGLNMYAVNDIFSSLDINIEKKILIKKYFKNIKKRSLWKQVFSKYKLNFQTNKEFFTHINGERLSLSKALLEDDGSLNINGERIYSLR